MLRISRMLVILSVLLSVGSIASADEILTNDMIVSMVKVGFGEKLIINKIKTTPNKFDVSVDGMLKLKVNNVPDDIISAMIDESKSKPKAEPVVAQPKTEPVAPPVPPKEEKKIAQPDPFANVSPRAYCKAKASETIKKEFGSDTCKEYAQKMGMKNPVSAKKYIVMGEEQKSPNKADMKKAVLECSPVYKKAIISCFDERGVKLELEDIPDDLAELDK